MTAERATGIILRTRPLTETSLIAHWLTPELGRLATVAKGARRPKSPFRGKLDLFYLADFSFQRSRRSDLHTLREVVLRETHPTLRTDFDRLRQAAYGALLVEQATETETPLPAIYRLLLELLGLLVVDVARPQYLLAFELKVLAESGLTPDFGESRLSPGARQMIERLLGFDLAGAGRLRLSAGQRDEISRFLDGFLTYHLGRVPHGRAEALGAPAQTAR